MVVVVEGVARARCALEGGLNDESNTSILSGEEELEDEGGKGKLGLGE